MNEHVYKQFDSDLDAIRACVTRMGSLVEEQVRNALDAFDAGDRELLELAIARDCDTDEMEVAIDDACTRILARRQPTAVDLRAVMAVGKTVTDLERIGDEAKKIAKATRKILERESRSRTTHLAEVRHMGERAAAMLEAVLDAYVRLDAVAATSVMRQDGVIDDHFRAIARQLVSYMMEDLHTISSALDIILIAKSIERIGDHCKNIAEDVIYVVKGPEVRQMSIEGSARESLCE